MIMNIKQRKMPDSTRSKIEPQQIYVNIYEQMSDYNKLLTCYNY